MSRIIKSHYGEYEIKTNISINQLVTMCKQSNVITFIDSNVLINWNIFNQTNHIIVNSNEDTKSLFGITELINKFIEKGANPKTKIIAIGGGIVQDAVGFIASIWCRGIEYILVPTTILSQVDSCIGGKTSINHIKKNILGTFWPPREILICTDFLSSLSDIDYWSGWGEWIKYNILRNKIDFTINTLNSIKKGNELPFILDGLEYKIGIIERDEFDKGERKFLNFGHTFGHAIEYISEWKIPHGYAIFIGSLIALHVSYSLLEDNDEFFSELKRLSEFGKQYINRSGIQNSIGCFDKKWFTKDIIEIAKKSDKKQENNIGLKMVLINKNEPYLHNVENENILEQSIKWVYNEVCI